MRRFLLFVLLLIALTLLAFAQGRRQRDAPARLPDGRSQNEEILKADHERNLKDAGELLKLAEELKIELEKNDRYVVSVGMLKKTEEIEKLSKRIRGRLNRF